MKNKNAVEYGYSLSKITRCKPIYTDLHKTSFALAQAILKHIKFSRGMLFIEDLAQKLKNKEELENSIRNDSTLNKFELSPSLNIQRHIYCFNDKLKFDFSGIRPSYMMHKADVIESIKKELTFEAKPSNNEIDTFSSNKNFIKLNLSDSGSDENEGHNKNDPVLRTFTFNDSDAPIENKMNSIHSVIHEEHEELNESRMITQTNEGSLSPPNKLLKLVCNTKSSPSLVSSNGGGGLLKLNLMGTDNSNKDEENPFKLHKVEESMNSSVTFSNKNFRQSHNESEQNNNVAPCSPDAKMRRKRRLRACEIANNPCMLIDNNNCSNKTSSFNDSANKNMN